MTYPWVLKGGYACDLAAVEHAVIHDDAMAPRPPGFRQHFGPNVKRAVWVKDWFPGLNNALLLIAYTPAPRTIVIGTLPVLWFTRRIHHGLPEPSKIEGESASSDQTKQVRFTLSFQFLFAICHD